MFARAVQDVIFQYEKDKRDLDAELRDLWRAVSQPRARTARIYKCGD